ncbi:MAG: hypothetical protein LC797_17445 [Chloroflexi bacterium]|nr:hypothetical protein [Chloroflexota bacterium]
MLNNLLGIGDWSHVEVANLQILTRDVTQAIEESLVASGDVSRDAVEPAIKISASVARGERQRGMIKIWGADTDVWGHAPSIGHSPRVNSCCRREQ